MSRPRRTTSDGVLYEEFQNPFSGLATMILFQAADDIQYLGESYEKRRDGYMLYKHEVVKFFKSDWAVFLADMVGLDRACLRRMVK